MYVASIRLSLAVLVFTGLALFATNSAQSATGTATVGQAVTFSVTADGTAPFSNQWCKNGVNIAGATAATYSISGVQLTDAGTYCVIVSNPAGSATSDNATLTVNPAAIAPVFTTQPAGQTVTVGASVTFTAAASGTPAPTYQWRKDGVNISGATSASYTISSVATGNAGTYTVVATNSAGSAISNGAMLTVNSNPSAPVFTVQPASQTVPAGTSVTFSVTASGSPTPTYQWRKNGAKISGATSSSYTIANVTTGSAGTYTVVATNSVGSTTSSKAVLTVITSAPQFTVQPAAWTVTAGASVTFTAAASGSPVPTYQWRKNGRRISWANRATFTIASVTTSSAGTYTVVATNSVGSVTSNGAVLQLIATTSIVPVDFNLDGHSDILWQNSATGERSISLMNGTTRISVVSLGVISSEWSIAGIGDFNGDGNPDVLWKNTATGELSLWLMNGTAQTSVISLGVVSTAWSVAGTGDFSGDGQTDILWQNAATGELSLWLMNGTARTNVVSLGVVNAGWSIAGTGDFNDDGHPDILWQNAVTGERSLWLMNGTVQTSIISLGVIGIDWSIAGTGDFNGDGQPDILWQNTVTGEDSVWLMSGSTQASVISLGVASSGWQIRN
jgi:plastocyanin